MSVRLENWYVTCHPVDHRVVLAGEVYDHPNPRCLDGGFVWTSYLKMIFVPEWAATTKNNSYKLGKPRQGWLDWLGARGQTVDTYCAELKLHDGTTCFNVTVYNPIGHA